MKYEVIYSKKAQKDLEKLNKRMQYRVDKILERVSGSPYSYAKKLVNLPFYRVRVGDYRAIIEIVNNKLIVHVIRIGLRKKIYNLIRDEIGNKDRGVK